MKSFKQFNEVAPPGWGHTKAEKEKTKPDKPKSKVGGSSAAFKRALDDGRFKGLPGDKTKKDKVASMFKLMWSMKKKGAKPHYKPGTDEKYKKYQKVDEALVSRYTKNWPKGSIDPSSKKERLAADLIDLEKQDKRAAWTAAQLRAKKKNQDESVGFTIDSGEHKKASKKAKIRNLAKGNTNPNEKAAAEKKAGGPKLIGEEECKCEGCGQDPCVVCGESHHNIEEGISTSDTKRLEKATVLSFSNDPKSVDRARARQVEVDYKDLMKQQAAKKKKKMKEETLVETPYRGEGTGRKENIRPNPIGIDDREKAKDTVKKVARGVGKVAGGVVKKVRSERDAVVGAGKAIKKKGTKFKTGLVDRIRKGVKKGAQAVGRVGAEVKKGYEAGLKSEAKMTPMQDNNLFGNAYAGSSKLQKEKKKAIEAIPDKSTEVYNKNWKHKTPDNPRESVQLLGADGKVAHEIIDIIKPEPMKVPESPMKWKELVEKVKLPATNGSIINVYLTWRGRGISIKLFFPQSRTRRPTREEVNSQIQKVYPGAKVGSFVESDPEPGEPFLQVGD